MFMGMAMFVFMFMAVFVFMFVTVLDRTVGVFMSMNMPVLMGMPVLVGMCTFHLSPSSCKVLGSFASEP